jgi:hypothetical protein
MQREFMEESGLTITDWTPFAEVEGDTWISYFFWAKSDRAHEAQPLEDQDVRCFPLHSAFSLPLMPNLKWLLPLCLDGTVGYGVVRLKNYYY